MNSKPTTSFFVALVSAVLMVPLLGASSTASAVPSAVQADEPPHSGRRLATAISVAIRPRPAQMGVARLGRGRQPRVRSGGGHHHRAQPDPDEWLRGQGHGQVHAADPGALTRLQVKTIKDGTWKSVDTSTQRSDGTTTFDIADPLEVAHQYRAVGEGGYGSNIVTYSGPLLDKNNDVPTVHFNTNDGDSVNTRDKWFKGEFSILAARPTRTRTLAWRTVGAVNKVDGEMRGRGNYSWSFAKKGFNLKFGDSIDLCGMGKSKKWALVANHYDRSLLRNSAAGFVGKIFTNLEWTPKDSAVDLYVNGSFRGSYILIERVNLEGGRIDRPELKAEDTPEICSGPDPSVDTTSIINGTYLMEWDFRKGANFNFGANTHGWVGLKEPEDEDYCQNMGAYINDYVDRADRDLYDGAASSNDWMSSIDLESAVDYYLAMEFLKPVDGQMWASVYMYKPRGEKIHFGPLWDFDLAMGSANRAGNVVSPRGWYLRNPLNVSAKQTEVTWFNRHEPEPDLPGGREGAVEPDRPEPRQCRRLCAQPGGPHRRFRQRQLPQVEPRREDQPVPGDQEQLGLRRRLPRRLAGQAVALHERPARQQRLKPSISRR